jgi:type VII secretion EsaA-like protein
MKNYHKLDKRLARTQNILIGILVVALISSVVALFVVNRKPVAQKKLTKPTIALVNEDLPTTFNKQDYNLGKSFVDSVSNDKNYNWQVVSRSVADRAYKEKSVDAVIYLPQTFSHDILTLQDIDPTQAKVDYKLQHQEDDLLEAILQERIVTVLHDFNQDVVKMYYASVASNIAEAESNMNGVVGNQENLVTDLIHQVNTPFKESLPNYQMFISGATGLKSMNQGTISAHNSFTEMTTKMLTQTSDSFAQQAPQVTAFFDLQKQISAINAENGNKSLNNQAKQNQAFYFEQFSGQNANILGQLSLFDIQARDVKTDEPYEAYQASFAELENEVKLYNQKTADVQKDLSTQISALTTRRDDLLKLEKDLYDQFFATDVTITQENYATQADTLTSSDLARKALAKKIQHSFGKQDNFTKSGALKAIQELMLQISVNPTDYQLETLLSRGSITAEMKSNYENDLKLIQNYANAYELPTGNVTLGEMPEKDTPVQHTLTQKVTVKVPPRTSYLSNVLPASVLSTTITEKGRTTPVEPEQPDGNGNSEETESGGEESGNGSNAEQPSESGNTGTTNSGNDANEKEETGTTPAPVAPKVVPAKQTATPRNMNANRELQLNNDSDDIVEYAVELEVTLDETTAESLELAWHNQATNESIYSSTLTFSFIPRDDLASYNRSVGLDNFEKLTDLFNNIEVTAKLITAFYGKPTGSLADLAKLANATSKEKFENISDDSIFNLYGNMNYTSISELLNPTDVSAFQKQGEESIKEVIALIQKMDTSLASLKEDKDNLAIRVPEDYFPTTLHSLQEWHDTTIQLIDTTYHKYQNWNTQTLSSLDTFYKSWKINEMKPLEVKSWGDYNSEETALYVNHNNDLYEQIHSLITSSNEASRSIAQNAQTVTDNSREFDSLVEAANATQSDAQKVLNSTDTLANTGSMNLNTSKNYYGNFSHLLANTRTQGADTNAIYDFFAKPIMATDATPAQKELVNAKNFDYRFILVFLIGLFAGMIFLMGWHKFSTRNMVK